MAEPPRKHSERSVDHLCRYLGRFGALLGHEVGQTLVEYELLLLFVAVVCIGALVLLGGAVVELFDSVAEQLPG